MRTTEVVKLLDGVTATTTSNNVYVGDCKKVAFIVTRADHGSGNSVFTFKGGMTPDPTATAPTMVALNVIETNVANTNSQTILRTTGATLAADGSSLLWLDIEKFPVEYVNCTVTETTDGTHTCWMLKIK
jgi:hypothetical protein